MCFLTLFFFSPPPPPHPLSHSLALVNPHTTDAAARYLSSDERVLAVKAEAPPTAMFVLCIFTSGTAILEIVNSIKQNVNLHFFNNFFSILNFKEGCTMRNSAKCWPVQLWLLIGIYIYVCLQPSYATTFDPRTRGYLVTVEGGTGKRGKQGFGGSHRRRWCVLDGSSLLCYQEEEVRFFFSYIF